MPKKFTKQDFNFVEKKNLEDVGDIPLCRKKSYRMLLDMNYRCKRVGGHTPKEGSPCHVRFFVQMEKLLTQ